MTRQSDAAARWRAAAEQHVRQTALQLLLPGHIELIILHWHAHAEKMDAGGSHVGVGGLECSHAATGDALGMRVLQLDTEASLVLNPHLRERAAQEEYMATMLALLQEFLGGDRHTMTTTYASDESNFFNCTFVKYAGGDDVVCAFLAWLKSTPAMMERSRSLIVTKGVTRDFALEVPAHKRIRLMCTIGSTKRDNRQHE